MSGYNPNASMLPASGGNIVAMSGGGVAKQHPNGGGVAQQYPSGGGGPPVSDLRSETGLPLDPLSSKDVRQQGSGAGLVFANGGSRKKRTLRQSQSGGVPAHLVPQSKSSATGTPPASTTPASTAPASTTPASTTASTTPASTAPASTTASSAPVPGSITTVSVTTSSTPTPDPKLTPAPATTSATTPTPTPLPVPSDPNNIDDILIKLIGSLPKTKDIYTNEEQDSLLKNLTLLLNSDTNKKFTIEIK